MPDPSPTHLSNRLRHLTTTSPTPTALFFARLWYALIPPTSSPDSHESLHTLALCFLASEQAYSALHLVRDHAETDLALEEEESGERRRGRGGCGGCALIVGRCCERLGRFTEGRVVLERAMKRGQSMSIPTLCPGTDSARAHLTLALLSHKGKAPESAISHYTKALEEDPWLWEAFTGMCDLGTPPSLESIFPDPPPITRSSSLKTSRPQTLSPNLNGGPMPRSSASEVPGMPARSRMSPMHQNTATLNGFFTPDVAGYGVGKMGMLNVPNTWDTPSMVGDTTFPTITEHPIPVPALPVASNSRRPLPNLISSFLPSASSMLPASLRSSTASSTSTPSNPEPAPTKPPAMKRPRGAQGLKRVVDTHTPINGLPLRRDGRDLKDIEPNGEEGHGVRRSTRLKTVPTKPVTKVVATRDKRATRSHSATSSNSAATLEQHSPSSKEARLQTSADEYLRDILRKCARAYRALSMYSTQSAIREIDTLSPSIQASPWSLDIIARSFYESSSYILSRRAFTTLRQIEPYRLQSMETYSTLLWHLGDLPSLSHLSQELIAIDRNAPQTWIAAGNAFSLAKNHEEAMRCFKRATQVEPGMSYGWVLCGFEEVEMEEFERGLGYFRCAVRTDSEGNVGKGRGYHAWYGMGLAYMKMGKLKYAEHHFRRAVEINPTNAVLLCCVGMVLEKMGDNTQALRFYEQACRYSPDSPMVAYKRIRVLVAIQRIEEAVSLLEPLVKKAPDEANVHFLLAKCYLRQGRKGEATVSFTCARELQPKLEGAIKKAMESDGDDDEDEEE